MMRWIDLPPMWLMLSLAVVWGIGAAIPTAVFGTAGQIGGGLLVLAGVGLMIGAVAQMLARRTTVIPRHEPTELMTTGLFAITRNPIYLGDAMVLCGAILWWDAALALPVLFGFIALIQRRFILAEEEVLQRAFGAVFEAWAARVPRWIWMPGR